MFRHHQVADHASRLAHVDLVRPPAVVDELVAGQAESPHVIADPGRHARVGGEEMEQAAMVVLVLLRDPLAPRVGRLGPLATRPGDWRPNVAVLKSHFWLGSGSCLENQRRSISSPMARHASMKRATIS